MCRAIAHRGPDDTGAWFDPAGPAALGHLRLSIIDLSPLGHQPMSNEDGTVWIAFNGEIYNYQELRADLVARGHVFRSQSDTEVLVHLYEERGPDFVRDLNGMFAISLWDMRQRRLLLARDHAGIKPVYYWQDGRRLFWASEIKSLLRVPGIPRQIDPARVAEYLTFLWVPGDVTMFRGIRKLEPGQLLLWQDGQVEIRDWFSLRYEPDERVGEAEWIDRVHDTFMRVTRRQMMSDVPLGAFLSGGADSSSIVACMRHSFPEREIRCYTAYWPPQDMSLEGFEADFPYAQRVADHLGVKLTSFELRSDAVKLLPKMIYHLDEPDADPAIFPSYLISQRARDDGTIVLLSGTGGDEVFFGYRSHLAYRQYGRFDRLPRWLTGPLLRGATAAATALRGAQGALPRRLRKFTRGVTSRGLARHLELVDWSSPAVRQRLLTGDARSAAGVPAAMARYDARFEGTGEINRHTHLLIQTFLAAHNFLYTDKSSMAASIEVRVPFLDVELMQLAARIPERLQLSGGVGKHLLKRAMRRYLPDEVLYRSKTGFGVPLRKWMMDELAPLIADLLSERRIRERGLFEPAAVQQIVRENRTNQADHGYLIYALLSLELWMQTFIDRPGEQVAL